MRSEHKHKILILENMIRIRIRNRGKSKSCCTIKSKSYITRKSTNNKRYSCKIGIGEKAGLVVGF